MRSFENTVELMGHYGSDETHALSAWTSTSRGLTDEKRSRIGPLLKSLAKDKHHSPFEKSSLHFLVTTDIASHIHILKHRIGVSTNAESARYKELLEDKFYIPGDWPLEEQARLKEHVWEAFDNYHITVSRLEPVLGRKRAKESARYYLPYASQITADVMFNWRSFSHFLGLRMKPDAQVEIRAIATKMLILVQEIPGNPFQHTIEAFGYDNRTND